MLEKLLTFLFHMKKLVRQIDCNHPSATNRQQSILVMWLERRFLNTEVDGSNPGIIMLFPYKRHIIRIASVDSAVN